MHFLSNDKNQLSGYSVLLCALKEIERMLLIYQVNRYI